MNTCNYSAQTNANRNDNICSVELNLFPADLEGNTEDF